MFGSASAAVDATRPILVFDVVETLLDTRAMKPVFERIFKDASARRTWLDNLFIYSEAMTITGGYADSGSVGVAVLRMMARTRDVGISPEDLAAFKAAAASLPAYPDVAPALGALRERGYRMVTLSNSPNSVSETQLRHAGIRAPFERLFSIDDRVRRYKPAKESYLAVAETLGVPPSRLWLVSCHAFDVMGAESAGLHAVFLSRPDNASFDCGPQPEAMISDLTSLPGVLASHET